MINMRTVCAGNLVRPRGIGHIAAAIGGRDGDLDLRQTPILARLDLRQNGCAALDRLLTQETERSHFLTFNRYRRQTNFTLPEGDGFSVGVFLRPG